MTATLSAPPVVRVRPGKPRSWRWLRLAVPFVLVVLFWAAAGVMHAVEEPIRFDPGTLSPTGTGRHGSSELADQLRAKGIAIERVTSSEAATDAARAGNATIFVPAPDFLLPGFLADWLKKGAGDSRVVLVQPGSLTVAELDEPVAIFHSRWATGITDPRCGTGYAQAAGAAGVRHDIYQSSRATTLCYGGSLLAVTEASTEIVYIGATDPFRNDRIGEHGNAALATALLTAHPRVIWVDVHATETVPVGSADFSLPEYQRADQDRTSTGNVLLDAFPATLWAVLLVLAVGAVLLAIARARRLGPPVPEPLPVLVPAAEAVTGRGRLYQRIGARRASLDALRQAAITRLARVLEPSAGTTPSSDRMVQLVAARTGWSPGHVYDVLYADSPDRDDDLVAAAAALDLLVQHVISPQPPVQGGTP